MPGWEPGAANGLSAGAWNRKDDQSKDHAPGPEVCWDKDGATAPLGLLDMSEDEKEVGFISGPFLPINPANSPLDFQLGQFPTQASRSDH